MEIAIGEHAGFCFGVQRALQMAFECAKNEQPCVTFGPLIHNPQEVKRLADAGVRSIDRLDELPPGHTVIIRSHGVTPAVYERCKQMGLTVADATCPHVAHIHELVRAYSASGDAVIIVGEREHPEVIGIAGWAKGPVLILADAKDAIAASDLPEKALVVAQTTIRRDSFEAVLHVLRKRVPNLTEHMTICAATSRRQKEAESLSVRADVVVVVGGRNSSNTRKLYETCASLCSRAILVETPQDIPANVFSPEDRVAITAGASTPQWLLEQVKSHILSMDHKLQGFSADTP